MVGDEQAEPEGGIEGVDCGFEVEVEADVATVDATLEGLDGTAAASGEQAVAWLVGDLGIALGGGDGLTDDGADRAAEGPNDGAG